VDYKIEKTVTYCEESQLKNLYECYLQEDVEKKIEYPKKFVPYLLSVYFFASKLEVSRHVNVEYNYEGDDFELKSFAQSGEKIVIGCDLHSGRCVDGKILEYDTKYSMFGTDREVKNFSLRIYKSEDDSDSSYLGASLSYEYELDFYNDLSPDWVQIQLYLNEEKFNNLVKMAEAKAIDSVLLTLGQVRGFYSQWSPESHSREIKILTRDVEVDGLKEDSKLTKVGVVGSCELSLITESTLNIKNNFKHESVAHMFEDDLGQDETSEGKSTFDLAEQRDSEISKQIQQLNKNFSSIKTLAWAVVVLLVLIFLNISNINMG
jgi:hypothetical protein